MNREPRYERWVRKAKEHWLSASILAIITIIGGVTTIGDSFTTIYDWIAGNGQPQNGSNETKSTAAADKLILEDESSLPNMLPEIEYMAFLEGSCTSATLNSIEVSRMCRNFARNTLYKNGRSAFSFIVENNSVSFVGKSDAQPHRDLYVLDVSMIVLGKFKEEQNLGIVNIAANGTCRIEGDVLKKASVLCSAITDKRLVFEVRFESKGIIKN